MVVPARLTFSDMLLSMDSIDVSMAPVCCVSILRSRSRSFRSRAMECMKIGRCLEKLHKMGETFLIMYIIGYKMIMNAGLFKCSILYLRLQLILRCMQVWPVMLLTDLAREIQSEEGPQCPPPNNLVFRLSFGGQFEFDASLSFLNPAGEEMARAWLSSFWNQVREICKEVVETFRESSVELSRLSPCCLTEKLSELRLSQGENQLGMFEILGLDFIRKA